MRVYATKADLGDDPPGDADRLIRRASRLADEHARTARYRVGEDGMPLDAVVRDAFRDAVVEQVRMWTVLGVDPSLGAAGVTRKPGPATTKSIGSASVTYQVSASAVADLAAATHTLSPSAADALDAVLTDRWIEVRG